MEPNIKILESFTLADLPDLDVVVLGALELFQREVLPTINLEVYKRPLVVGSGNAEAMSRIIFQDFDAIFASESNFEQKLKTNKAIDGVVIVSASGEKHAPIIAKVAKSYDKHLTLLTNSVNSSASLELDHLHEYDEYIFPKNREPYTYNTSTYMGYILGYTKENPKEIYDFIKKNLPDEMFEKFAKYDKFFLIVPPKFLNIIRMLEIKFIELFGRNVARDIATSEFVRHHVVEIAKSDELFISFGCENKDWGNEGNRLEIPLPENADYGAMMAIGYYVIGQIQKRQKQYFKEGIIAYAEKMASVFNEKVSPIVE